MYGLAKRGNFENIFLPNLILPEIGIEFPLFASLPVRVERRRHASREGDRG
jgi:hypothetical protein